MICAIIEHYLSDAGRAGFSSWVERVETALRSNPDALSFRELCGVNVASKSSEPARCMVELRFRSLAALATWVATEQHREVLSWLEEHTLQQRSTTIYAYRDDSKTSSRTSRSSEIS